MGNEFVQLERYIFIAELKVLSYEWTHFVKGRIKVKRTTAAVMKRVTEDFIDEYSMTCVQCTTAPFTLEWPRTLEVLLGNSIADYRHTACFIFRNVMEKSFEEWIPKRVTVNKLCKQIIEYLENLSNEYLFELSKLIRANMQSQSNKPSQE